MPLPPVLVTGYNLTLEQSALLLLDLDSGTYEVLRPFPGPIHATPDTLYLARFQGARTRLEKYDQSGLCWMKRVADCVDTHSVTRVGEELAVCSTGTNEVIFLDREGTERRRWSPDPTAEADSWHLNSLTSHEGRLFVSCFGRFNQFRGWGGNIDGAGMVLDVATGEVVLRGLSGPHDPHRVEGGWVLSESNRARLLWVPDGGSPEELLSVDGFPRGLLILPDHFVLGVSSPRQPGWSVGRARLQVIDRAKREIVRSIPLPYGEIGHVVAAPSAEVLEAMYQEQARQLPCLLPRRGGIEPDDRAGGIAVEGPLRVLSRFPAQCELTIRVFNKGNAVWATEHDLPINVGYQIVNSQGGRFPLENTRTRLPLPVGAGKSLTFTLELDLTICLHLPNPAALQITLVQEKVAWWEASDRWSPAVVPLPTELISPSLIWRLGRWRG